MTRHIVAPEVSSMDLLHGRNVESLDTRAGRRRYSIRGGQDGKPTEPAKSSKKWLRTPLFGPGTYICYDCATRIDVTYFAVLRRCPDCNGRRFLPSVRIQG